MDGGATLDGYELEVLLGRGSFGEVWQARRRADGLAVALKVLRFSADEAAVARFRREARAARRVASPHVCRVLDSHTEGAAPYYIAFERLEGETLEARLDRDGDLPLHEALRIADELLDALGAAHGAGVVHRDIKPSNVFLEQRPTGPCTRLLDFGIAKSPDDDTQLPLRTTAGSTLGSLAYMAPEQAGAAERSDGRTDLYGLGAVLFRALAGRPPFAASTPATMLALKLDRDAPTLSRITGVGWPRGVEELLERLLARDPARRLPTAAAARTVVSELRERLRAVTGGG